jgi:hypothetical protein
MKGLPGDVYRIMPQVVDGAAEPLSIDRLEGHRITNSISTFVHASSLQDEDVILRQAAEWNKV